MRTRSNRPFLAFALLLAPALPAQIPAPLLPSGQPAIMPFVPAAIAPVPPPVVWAAGNPAFALSSFAPAPVPPGLPTFLVLGFAVAPPIPLLPPLVFPPFGVGMLTNAATIVLPAGPSGPVPGPIVPFPIPPTFGPIGVLSVHTLVLAPGGLMLTGALGLTI
jgi:hypothetical protein